MNKKGFIFGFLLFVSCFFVIGNVKALRTYNVNSYNFENFSFTYNGFTYNKDYIYNYINDKLALNNKTLSDFKYIFISVPDRPNLNENDGMNGISFTLLNDCDWKFTVSSSNWYLRIRSINNEPFSFFAGKIKFKDRSFQSLTNIDKVSSDYLSYYFYYIYNFTNSDYGRTTVYTNTFIDSSLDSNPNDSIPSNPRFYYDNNMLGESNHNVSFHLNGGSIMDFSNPLMPTYTEEDFQISTNKSGLQEYLSNITPMKDNSDFVGWYYDSNFTTPYNSSDSLTNNIDLYAKFQSKIYNINDIDYIEYRFNNIPLHETELNVDYTFKTVTYDGQDDDIDFSSPFARDYYTGCDDTGQNCTVEEKYKDLLIHPIGTTGHNFQDSGSHILNSNPEHITNSFSFIVPFEHSMGFYVYLDFSSNLDYEMIIHYKDDVGSVNSYIDTVDITGKYGVIFLPKYDDSNYADLDSYYLTNFRIVGNVDVQVTDSRDMNNYNIQQLYSMNYCNTVYSEQTEIPYNCDNQSGIFSFRIDNLRANQTLRFVNHSYTEMSDRRTFIEYDTRYFNYGILDEPTSVVQIEDPTTHVVETVGLNDFYNQFNEENIGKSKISFKSAFNKFISPIKFIIRTVTKLYNNYLSNSVQHYFFLVFSLMILMLLIRVIF